MKIRQTILAVAAALACALAGSAWAQDNGGSNRALQADASVPATTAAAGDAAATARNGHDANYVIGNDDVLSINVWNEKDLTHQVPVRSDGNISMPLIGEVHATGRTPLQLEQDISTKLRAFITQPDVTVMVMQMNSRKFSILGRVMRPGSYPLTTTTTVLDAIAVAGGFQDFAKQKSMYILRPTPGGGTSRIAFNYKDVVRGRHPEENIQLEPHDTIVVP
ncbi:MAG TPA: polysaccharide biosynthesis/export family protein [Acidobacteriaceae bacterium]|nr:polysaccharide biosynthesis/export family protein [Acidobacteriaceae bacterium]